MVPGTGIQKYLVINYYPSHVRVLFILPHIVICTLASKLCHLIRSLNGLIFIRYRYMEQDPDLLHSEF